MGRETGGDHAAYRREANRYYRVYEPVVEDGGARVDWGAHGGPAYDQEDEAEHR